jgi:hypothetical protein
MVELVFSACTQNSNYVFFLGTNQKALGRVGQIKGRRSSLSSGESGKSTPQRPEKKGGASLPALAKVVLQKNKENGKHSPAEKRPLVNYSDL